MNEERKERYLQYRENVFGGDDSCQRMIKNVFGHIEKFEEKYNKDCSEFIAPEIMNFYKYLNTSSITSLQNVESQLASYTTWCINEHLTKDNQNHYQTLDREDLERALNKKVASNQFVTRDDMIDVCNHDSNWRNKALLMAVFEGIKGDNCIELLDLERDDLLGNNMVFIKSRGKAIKISSFLYNIFEHSVDEMKIEYPHKQIGIRVFEFDPSQVDKVIKLKTTHIHEREPVEKNPRATIYTLVSRILRSYSGTRDLRGIKMMSISDSGIVHYILNRAAELKKSPMDYFSSPEALKEIKDRFGRRIVRPNFLAKYGDHIK